jgi:replication factor C small subunit
MSTVTDLFVEKLRPKHLSQLIIPDRIRKQLQNGLIQNLLFISSPGTGKTSAMFILAQGHDTLYINASEERGIDTIRDKIAKFCSTISLDGGKENLKCVILDECEGATKDFWMALKATQERYSANSRILASCNTMHGIPDAIKSRFNIIEFDALNKEEENYLLEEYYKRISNILKAAKIEADINSLEKFVKNSFPDMRALLTKVQSLYLRGVKELNQDNININYDYGELFNLCLNSNSKPYDNYKEIINQYGSRVDDCLVALGNEFPEYLKNTNPEKIDKLPMVLIAVAEYQYQKNFVIDTTISLLAAVFKIQQILK